MKRITAVICALAMLFALAACGVHTGSSGSEGLTEGETGERASSQNRTDTFQLRVIDGAGTGQLVLAGTNSGEVYTAGEEDLTVFLDDKPASVSELKDGMLLTVDPGYMVLESWPGQLTGATVRAYSRSGSGDDRGDICGLYLQVLEDLWAADSALNEDISYISVYLDEAPGDLTDGEKAAVAWIFSGRHNAQGLQLGFEELEKNGYIEKDVPYWKDGVLLSITKAGKGKDSAKKITFDAEKWRSGTGAVFYTGCSAERGTGIQWKPYEPGGFAVS